MIFVFKILSIGSLTETTELQGTREEISVCNFLADVMDLCHVAQDCF